MIINGNQFVFHSHKKTDEGSPRPPWFCCAELYYFTVIFFPATL